MWSEHYPYEAAGSQLGADVLVPEIYEKKMGRKYKETLYDPQQDKFLSKEEYLKLAKEDPFRQMVAFNPARKKWMPYWLRTYDRWLRCDLVFSGLGRIF